MRFHTALLLVTPLLGFAQAPPPGPAAAPPAEVDQALRAQATAFLKYQMEGNFRKAYDLVSEDSKDYYLGSTKEKSTSLDLQKIEYSDNFTKAVVSSSSKQVLMIQALPVTIPGSRMDRWKLEDGKWKWYHDASEDGVMTLLGRGGPAAPLPAGSTATQAPPVPKDVTPESAIDAMKKVPAPVIRKPTLDRRTISFTVDKETTEEIVYHNNSAGEIRVEADLIADFPGFVVQKFQLKAQEEIAFKVSYHPSGKGVFKAALRFTVQPFEQEITIPLMLSKESNLVKP
jgi:hypothetical protein